ncbi:alpha/beta hydrolase [Falsiroseomonas tokyonensis]|uniref:Alpha/beta hydrolase n=1 Tax=Falsiroseomonas tokyonensis TaxID=430521 RepID=A0ABV7BZ49_9PROT|nr:alpha/beta hydrolase [Falsiroseomonas tokyonensis]MBU8540275.1 alpha/beta hydrolase [Falsiroseomonas tokyonensis]
MAKKPKTPAKSGSTIIHFATNRARMDAAFCMDADKTAPARLWLGRVEVELLGKPEETEAKRDVLRPPDIAGQDDFKDPAGGDCAQLLQSWLAEAAAQGAVPLLFIHGFSNSFDSAVTRAAQLQEFYGAAGVALAPLVFSWPSDGKVIAANASGLISGAKEQYWRDQQDAAAAGPALARLLAQIRNARSRAPGKPQRLVLLAHSMGNHALAYGLLSLANGLMTREMRGLFGDAVMASADVDSGAFGNGMSLRILADLADRVTVAISRDSTLSLLSRIANEGSRRLGHFGAEDLAVLPPNLEVVDYFEGLSWSARQDILPDGGSDYDSVQHQWYRNDPNARVDLAAVLSGAKPPTRKSLAPADQVVWTFEGRIRRHAYLPQPTGISP